MGILCTAPRPPTTFRMHSTSQMPSFLSLHHIPTHGCSTGMLPLLVSPLFTTNPALSCPNTPFKNTHPSPIRINTPYLHFRATPQMCLHSHLHPTAPIQFHTGHRTPPFHVPTTHSKRTTHQHPHQHAVPTLVVITRETSKGSIPGEQLWLGM